MNEKKWRAYYESKNWASVYLAEPERARKELAVICGKLRMVSFVENFSSKIPQMVGKARAMAGVLGISQWKIVVAK